MQRVASRVNEQQAAVSGSMPSRLASSAGSALVPGFGTLLAVESRLHIHAAEPADAYLRRLRR
jgi:hypothetical protein